MDSHEPATFYANAGPPDRIAGANDLPSPIGVILDPATPLPIGSAFAAGSVVDPRGRRYATWRLEVRGEKLDGLYLLDRRAFVPLADYLERWAIDAG